MVGQCGERANPEIIRALDIANKHLAMSFAKYQEYIGDRDFAFHEPTPFKLTRDKSYTAKTSVPLRYKNNRDAGIIHVVAFAPGDATGDTSTYSLNQVHIPYFYEYTYSLNQVHIPYFYEYNARNMKSLIPRSKSTPVKTIEEYFFPFFTVFRDNVYEFGVCLEELTLRKKADNLPAVSGGATLGMESKHLFEAQAQGLELVDFPKPKIQYTVGEHNGRRTGDPHAILYDALNAPPNSIQVAGFLAIKDPNDPLRKVLGERAQWPIWDMSNLF